MGVAGASRLVLIGFWLAMEVLIMEQRNRLVTLDTVAEETGINLRTLRAYASKARIPVVRIGKRVYVDPAAFAAWVQERTFPARAD